MAGKINLAIVLGIVCLGATYGQIQTTIKRDLNFYCYGVFNFTYARGEGTVSLQDICGTEEFGIDQTFDPGFDPSTSTLQVNLTCLEKKTATGDPITDILDVSSETSFYSTVKEKLKNVLGQMVLDLGPAIDQTDYCALTVELIDYSQHVSYVSNATDVLLTVPVDPFATLKVEDSMGMTMMPTPEHIPITSVDSMQMDIQGYLGGGIYVRHSALPSVPLMAITFLRYRSTYDTYTGSDCTGFGNYIDNYPYYNSSDILLSVTTFMGDPTPLDQTSSNLLDKTWTIPDNICGEFDLVFMVDPLFTIFPPIHNNHNRCDYFRVYQVHIPCFGTIPEVHVPFQCEMTQNAFSPGDVFFSTKSVKWDDMMLRNEAYYHYFEREPRGDKTSWKESTKWGDPSHQLKVRGYASMNLVYKMFEQDYPNLVTDCSMTSFDVQATIKDLDGIGQQPFVAVQEPEFIINYNDWKDQPYDIIQNQLSIEEGIDVFTDFGSKMSQNIRLGVLLALSKDKMPTMPTGTFMFDAMYDGETKTIEEQVKSILKQDYADEGDLLTLVRNASAKMAQLNSKFGIDVTCFGKSFDAIIYLVLESHNGYLHSMSNVDLTMPYMDLFDMDSVNEFLQLHGTLSIKNLTRIPMNGCIQRIDRMMQADCADEIAIADLDVDAKTRICIMSRFRDYLKTNIRSLGIPYVVKDVINDRGNQQCNHIMKFRDLFQIHHDVSTGDNLIEIEDIYAYLSRAGDNLIKKNVVRGIRAFQGGSRSFLGKDCATFLGLLKYLCNHPKERGCKTLLNTIEKDIITDNKGIVPSSYELYKLIAKTKILRAGILFDELTLSEEDIPTLVIDHKSHFTDAEWKKISWFENDFAKSVELLFETSYEEVLNKKYSRFQTLISLSECCKNLHHSAKHQIRRNVNRIQLADKEGEVKLCAGQVHIASIIDNDIKTSTDLFCPNTIENAVCFDITSSSKRNTIWAVFLQSSPIECDFDDLCKRIFYLVKRKHNVYLEKIFLLDQVTASNYSSSDGSILRFYLRDDVETNRITSICRTWVAETLIDDTIDLQEELQCEQCFNRKTNNTPLDLETFDIVQEWYLELPIELQLILEQFLNIYSLKYKVKDFQEISHTKLERLYAVYDTLLNIFNRKYIGIFQKNNANKLLIEYKSVGSVFDVTTSAGVTPSLKYAEQKLKSEGKSDLCYYNTYLKENELQYEAFGGEQKTHVSLRKCHLILMLDNLVRLQYIADPDPGEHRSKQLCTLPITIQGLPIDSQVTEAWHLPECDGTFNCLCKESATIEDETASTLLTELRDEERESRNNFFNWMTFGNQLIWSNLPDDLLEQISVTQTSRPQYTHEVEGVDLEDETTVGDCDDDVGTDCQDEDIVAILGSVDIEGPEHPVNQTFSDEDDEISELTSLEKSIDEMSILEHDIVKESSDTIQNRLKSFGFEKFKVPQLLCRHPPPAIGRDDDIEKIREILDDVLVKGGYEANKDKCLDRILCGPDNKIGKCLFQLMNRDSKYQTFLPEFPLLHLRKSKINILISAYKNAGLLEILQVMRGDEKNDWGNLISIQHIDVATKHVRRLAMAFHLAFLIAFTHFLPKDELQEFLSDMEAGDCVTTSVRWSNQFHCFLDYGSSQNSTFALHFDMMQHCNDIVAISFSERLGGETGYNLLLGAVKSSLLFSFVNGATSYAPYCTQLLYSHYTAGYFHQCMKKTLYTTPFKNSSKNFALDTKREMDHLDAVKGFRSGSNIDSITCRMSLIDSLNEASLSGIKQKQIAVDDNLGMDISETDLQHVYPAAALILRRGGLSLEESPVPFNVYSKVPLRLPSAILDASSVGAGKYLLNKYLQQQKLVKIRIGMETDIDGPKDLVNRVKRTKGVTIKRFQKARVVSLKTERQAKEDKQKDRQKKTTDKRSWPNNQTSLMPFLLRIMLVRLY